ncbi:hypothetical protein ALO79_200311 [Pseudomonas syringae pv. castaneae]|uniref:Uncharacterized protein n=1 Tax=Pseudomonas syringae pv. castaneae TaxID=264450 RepID=A0A0P9MJL9_PSESX|nr:hypothetical protein ALO79_200311 [Pseudomonas syringae pv. castaneae]
MAAVGLEHHRAASRQGRRGVATGRGKGQREIAGAEHRHRAQADTVLTQVRARQRLALRQGLVDTRTIEITTAQDFGEQTHLPAGTPPLTLDPCGRQRGFTADHGDELIAQGVQFIGDGLEELGPAHRAQAAVSRVSRGRRLGGCIDLFSRGLDEITRQGFASAGIEALQTRLAGRAARPTDVVVTKDLVHRKSPLKVCR